MTINASIIKKLIRKSYILSKYLYHYKLQKKGLGTQPIVIFQMGKVGSTSILHSLQVLNSSSPIFQVHTLSKKGVKALEQMYWGNIPGPLRKSLLPETEHVFTSHFLKSQIKRNIKVKWKFITLVRDPNARNVSEFFYSVDTTKDDPHLPDFYRRLQAGTIKTSDLIDRFLERFNENSNEYQLPMKWFDEELLSVLGVDVFSTTFPKSKGYQIINQKTGDILILKLEKLMDCYHQAFYEFLNLSDFKLIWANTARQKRYYSAYKSFMDEVDLPAQYISKIYDSKLVRHFYDESEVMYFRKKWHKFKSLNGVIAKQ